MEGVCVSSETCGNVWNLLFLPPLGVMENFFSGWAGLCMSSGCNLSDHEKLPMIYVCLPFSPYVYVLIVFLGDFWFYCVIKLFTILQY